MPRPTGQWSPIVANRLIFEQQELLNDSLQVDAQGDIDQLNSEQCVAYDAVPHSTLATDGIIFFLSGDVIEYEALASSLREEPWDGDPDSILFATEHLRFSDDQVENWRREFHRIEEDSDEEGFEEL
ncbi:hypothetical protein Droror1_Dr00027270 [Drosera rotundifolia]